MNLPGRGVVATEGAQESAVQIEMNFAGVETSAPLELHIEEMVDYAVAHVEPHITRVEIYLHDDNADKQGATDKRCVMEVRPAGRKPFAVEERGDDVYGVIKGAAEKLRRALGKRLHS